MSTKYETTESLEESSWRMSVPATADEEEKERRRQIWTHPVAGS